ncbi:MAG: tripartite tricarboxylate transporter permease [Spirochaetales bacterium]|uniref:tripartite tricarboxylate transporter permease n=1 Tax=Bullifex sp. TaxID=2815808 RepID=UPI002A4ED5A9|nr:tripartite tricarboxylate transporter permease [Bullifex sp.]MDD5973263.1 tripartite tricarboxylate transporter permease [Spirochaetales bacterium]MDD7272187.1 tripartite tricarboxylate transporter permease [Spirochaetales bacterium]MDY4066522.1 tripartite tricarboxylate transporter permease [Bullifex sp.]
MFSNLIAGFINVLQPFNFLMAVFGTVAGVVIGALPGLSGSTGIILLLPLVYKIDASAALLLLCGLFCGSMYGGSISAILLNTPGTPSATATLLDGYPMTQNGDAGRALGISAVSSFIGGLVSAICLALIAPQLAKVALSFTSPDFFALSIFGLSIMASTGKDTVKGLISGFIGLLISTVGVDQVAGIDRFTFGNVRLMRGLQLLPVLIGVFALSEVFTIVQKGGEREGAAANQRVGRVIPTKADFTALLLSAVVGGLIGVFIGIIPGTGGAISCFLAYQVAKKLSKRGDKFGTGVPEGIAAPEASNNGTTGGALIPMLCLGVPGDTVTSVMLGALTLIGVRPGPQMFVEPEGITIVYAILAGMIVIQFIMLVTGLSCAKVSPKILKIPQTVLLPIIAALCIVGAFSNSNNLFDVLIAIVFGILGFGMKKFGYPGAPLVLGIVLGPIAESNLNRALILSENSWTTFVTHPISCVFLILSLVIIVFSVIKNIKEKKSE